MLTGLILVDSQPSDEYFTPHRSKRSRVNVKLPQACAGSGLVVPELLDASKPGLYESLKLFSQDAWHTEILCGEQKLPPTYGDYTRGLSGNNDPASQHSKLYTALDPQAFILMLSSALWERNLRYLEQRWAQDAKMPVKTQDCPSFCQSVKTLVDRSLAQSIKSDISKS